MPRWSKIVIGVAAVLVLAIGVTVAIVWSKLPQLVADRASKATGRTVQIGALTLSPGRWVGVELHDASIANLPGGTRPQMATLGSLTGEVELWPLLHGTIVARSVQVEKADILLEKVGEQPNWRNGPKRPEKPDGGRASFPTILNAVLDGAVTFRTSSGNALMTRLDQVKLDASAADRPARITGPGSYHGAPVVMDLKLGSYDQLHDAATPFPTDITLTSGDTVLHFVGTMTKPLDVDGADGHLSLLAPTPGALEKIAGIDPTPAPKLRLEGAFQHDADLWKLEQAKGALGEAELEDGTLALREGSTTPPKTPDKIDLALRFGRIDADRLMAEFKNGSSSGGGDDGSGFVPEAEPNPQVTAKLETAELSYDKIRLIKPKLSAAIEPKQIKLDEMSFDALGGAVRLDGRIEAEADGKSGAVSATVSGTGLEVADLRQALGAGHLPLSGRVDLHAVAEGVGRSAAAALKAGRASVVATMAGGSVSAQIVKLASTDVTGLLTSSRTMVGLDCLLAVAEVRGGVAFVGPLRLRSADGTVVARGRVDLLGKALDVTVASESATTGALALDIPVRVSGSFDDPTIRPAGATAGQAALVGGSAAAPLRAYAQRSSCAR
ncbi:MAG: AsmA family protein [Janthinobacterium lividum]